MTLDIYPNRQYSVINPKVPSGIIGILIPKKFKGRLAEQIGSVINITIKQNHDY